MARYPPKKRHLTSPGAAWRTGWRGTPPPRRSVTSPVRMLHGVQGGEIPPEGVAQEVEGRDTHDFPPGFEAAYELSLYLQRLLAEPGPGAAPEPWEAWRDVIRASERAGVHTSRRVGCVRSFIYQRRGGGGKEGCCVGRACNDPQSEIFR